MDLLDFSNFCMGSYSKQEMAQYAKLTDGSVTIHGGGGGGGGVGVGGVGD